MQEAGEERTFTLSEARQLLPVLRELTGRLSLKRRALAEMQLEIDRARANAEMNGGSSCGAAYLLRLADFTEAVQKIEALGVLLKDFRTFLIDFPYEHHGRIVYLCWRPDEEQIEWWHETDSGFAGRQPLTEEFR